MKQIEAEIMKFEKETIDSSSTEYKVLKQVQKDKMNLISMVNQNLTMLKF